MTVDLQPGSVVIEIMNFVDYSHSLVSILPPLVALSLAILTRRVLISLGAGIVLGALLLTDFSLGNTFSYLKQTATELFVVDGDLNYSNLSILL
ncbi:hypothetical protein REH76_16395, partial [Photobacterium damselae]